MVQYFIVLKIFGQEDTGMIENVTIVGAGAMGTMVGDAFVKLLGPEKVRFLAHGDRLARYQADGIFYNGTRCDFRFTDGSEDQEADLLIFAVKDPGLADAMDLAQSSVGRDTIILSLLNGTTSEETLGLRFGMDKVLYTVTRGMDPVRVDNTIVRRGEGGNIFVGIPQEDYFDQQEKLDTVVDFLEKAGLPVVKEPDILHIMWSKFMLNVGVNQVCMLFELDYEGVQKPGPARDMMIAAMDEVRKISACQGVLLTRKDLQESLAVIDSLAPDSKPSMRQDGLAHRKTEVDMFAGAVMAMADRFGMKVPVNQEIYQKVKEMEKTW